MRRSTPVLTAAALLALAGCGAAAATPRSDPVTATSTPATAATRQSVSTNLAAASAGAAAGATVTTTGTGTVSGTPDVMTLDVGVQNTALHVSTALNANNATSGAVQAALVRDGVAVADIQTAQLSLYPQQNGNTITGYQVSDTVTATLRNLAKAGTTIDGTRSPQRATPDVSTACHSPSPTTARCWPRPAIRPCSRPRPTPSNS